METQNISREEQEKMGLKEAISFAPQGELAKPITFGEDPNEKKYLLFYIYTDDEGNDVKDWELIVGRNEFYNFIKSHADTMDLRNSKALTGTLTVEDAVSVYDIIRSFKEQGMYDDDFHIENYDQYSDGSELDSEDYE